MSLVPPSLRRRRQAVIMPLVMQQNHDLALIIHARGTSPCWPRCSVHCSLIDSDLVLTNNNKWPSRGYSIFASAVVRVRHWLTFCLHSQSHCTGDPRVATILALLLSIFPRLSCASGLVVFPLMIPSGLLVIHLIMLQLPSQWILHN